MLTQLIPAGLDPVEMFKALNGLSPLAVIGLLSYIIYQLIASKKADRVVAENLVSVKDNHLSELPEAIEAIRSIQASLVRMETILGSINSRTIYLASKIKNGSHGVLDD